MSGPLAGTWDCHVHCFEPDSYPYKAFRAYTPRPAPFEALARDLLMGNVMLVQATIEQGPDGLLTQLEQCRDNSNRFSGRVRGTLLADDEASLATSSEEELDRMQDLGVRCVRLHGLYGGSGHDLCWVQSQMKALTRIGPVRKYGWSISAQLPLQTWSQLKRFILTDADLENVSIVADHIAGATPSDYGSSALEDFIELLQSGRVYVKISALHRRSPLNIHGMQPIVSLLAQAAPSALLWGSDWPHVDTSQNEYEAGPLEGVKADSELAAIQSW